MARVLLSDWVSDGWIEVAQAARRTRAYELSAKYRQFIGKITAVIGDLDWESQPQ
jgi:hypothetical protein